MAAGRIADLGPALLHPDEINGDLQCALSVRLRWRCSSEQCSAVCSKNKKQELIFKKNYSIKVNVMKQNKGKLKHTKQKSPDPLHPPKTPPLTRNKFTHAAAARTHAHTHTQTIAQTHARMPAIQACKRESNLRPQAAVHRNWLARLGSTSAGFRAPIFQNRPGSLGRGGPLQRTYFQVSPRAAKRTLSLSAGVRSATSLHLLAGREKGQACTSREAALKLI